MGAVRSTQAVVILAGYVMGALALSWGLPEQVPPSWTVPGRGAVWLGGPMVAFLLPTAAAITNFLLRGLCARHPVDEASAIDVLAIYDAIMLRFSIFVVGVHGAVLLAILGLLSGREWAGRIVPLMLGFTTISIGNLLPKTRPNLAIGVRTRRTIADRALWNKTHRSAGYIAVACGAVIVVSALTVPGRMGAEMILLAGPVSLAATCLLLRGSKTHVDA
jgi:immunity protein, SdpI family